MNTSVSISASRQNKTTYGHVHGNDGESDDGKRVRPLGALRTITQRKEETSDEESEVEIPEYVIYYMDPRKLGPLYRLTQNHLHRKLSQFHPST